MVDGEVKWRSFNPPGLMPPKPRLPSHASWFSSREALYQHTHSNSQQMLSENFQKITISIHIKENKYFLKYNTHWLYSQTVWFPMDSFSCPEAKWKKSSLFTPLSQLSLITVFWWHQGLINSSERSLFFPSSLTKCLDMASLILISINRRITWGFTSVLFTGTVLQSRAMFYHLHSKRKKKVI